MSGITLKCFVYILIALFFSTEVIAQAAKKQLTLELVSKSNPFIAPGISQVTWRPDGKRITYMRQSGTGKDAVRTLCSYEIKTGKEHILFDSSKNDGIPAGSYQWSPKGDVILLEGQADLWLLDVRSGKVRRLTKDPEEEEGAAFSPTGNAIAFVKENNLFALELQTGLIEKLTAEEDKHVLNGKLDWVYEEELGSRNDRSYEWSPDGSKIAFLRLDENRVPEFPLIDYGSVHPKIEMQRYPKSGDLNSLPSVHVVTVGQKESQTFTVPLDLSRVEYVAPQFSWTPDSKEVCFLTLNRAQNELTVHLWDPSTKDRELFIEKDAYWLNSIEPPHFLKDGRFLWLSEKDGWLHLYLYGRDGAPVKQLTQGDWMIDSPNHEVQIDEMHGWIYFTATEKDPRERHVYRIKQDGSEMKRLSQENGTHTADLSPDGLFYAETFSAVNQPPLRRLFRADGSFTAVLDKPESHVDEYELAVTEFVELNAPDGAKLYASLVKPAGFDPEKKYPVIIDIYGGPSAQVVRNSWHMTPPLSQFLTQEGFLIWSLDNRGSSGRGHGWETPIFKDMGKKELEDQLAGVSYLKSLPFVDPSSIGIVGWSYGGYMTLYALTHAPEVFKCGIAGAPVTDWKYYDSIYTERYMTTPSENQEGYKNSSPLEAADKLQSKLLIIHGTADDNVHLQNTMNFINALIKAKKPFDLQIHPGQAHGFYSDASRFEKNAALVDFFKKCL